MYIKETIKILNTKEVNINEKGMKVDEEGKDWYWLQMLNLKKIG